MKLIHHATTCICVDGPYPEQDQDGDEIPAFVVAFQDDEGNDTQTPERYYHYNAAVRRGQELARQHPTLELVIDASRP